MSASSASSASSAATVGSEPEPPSLVHEPVGRGEHPDRHAADDSDDTFGRLRAGGTWTGAIEDGDTGDGDARRTRRGTAFVRDGGRDLQEAVAEGLRQAGPALDDQHVRRRHHDIGGID
ncbi:hypothetical protein [Nocardia thraciensis]